ncbi:MAG: hypothetical protein IJO72_05410 [Oscillospiraceae bacterium]|nr:hypothetical protein [Oscillospiraceae bacterium]
MKRWLALLALTLLLGGCSYSAPTDNTDDIPATLPQTPNQVAPSLYDEGDPIEAATDGAVKAYLPEDGCEYIVPMGKNLVLFGENSIVLLRGERLTQVASAQLFDLPKPDSGKLQIREDGIAYYDAGKEQIVFLNQFFREVGTFSLPKDIEGDVYLTPDWKMFYYCSEQGVHALNLDTGVSRLLKEQAADWQGVNGGLLNGMALRCSLKQADGTVQTMLLSGETGTVLAQGDYLESMLGGGECYYALSNGAHIFGIRQEQTIRLQPDGKGKLYPLPDGKCAVVRVKTKTGCRLDYYDIVSGRRTASVKLDGIDGVSSIYAYDGVVFFTAEGVLYRWETALSLTQEQKLYTAPYYHYTDPDEAGLASVGQLVNWLEETYDVRILYWKEAEGLAPWDYSFTAEHDAQLYEQYLPELEKTLRKFPTGFFEDISAWSSSGRLNIVLVQGIYGGAETEKYTSASGIQYHAGGDAYIALTVGEDMDSWFLHELGHLLDTRILSTTDAYSGWNSLNPWDFKYDNDYEKNQDRTDTRYLEGDRRYFVDLYSMSFAVEDRSRIFEYACMPGNEAVFASQPMQKKLKTLCQGMRKAFDLEGESYIWEQYLKT